MTRRTALLLALLAIVGATLISVVNVGGGLALTSLLRHGGTVFVPVAKDSRSLSPSMRLALEGPVPPVAAGPLTWRDVGDGVEVAELPVLAGGREVDRIDLARIDLAWNRIVVRNAAAGRYVEDWTKRLGARLVINGSYYAATGLPDLGATLNLDGGPIACQQVQTAVFSRDFCGRWELNDQGGNLAQLTWLYGRFALPVVIAAIPR